MGKGKVQQQPQSSNCKRCVIASLILLGVAIFTLLVLFALWSFGILQNGQNFISGGQPTVANQPNNKVAAPNNLTVLSSLNQAGKNNLTVTSALPPTNTSTASSTATQSKNAPVKITNKINLTVNNVPKSTSNTVPSNNSAPVNGIQPIKVNPVVAPASSTQVNTTQPVSHTNST